MIGDLDLGVLSQTTDHLGYVASIVVTDELIVALGGTSSTRPFVMVSADTRTWEPRRAPSERGLRDVVAVGDSLWACGEWGQLAVSRDHGASWQSFRTDTEGCLFGVALGHDGAIWVVGDHGYAARILGEKVHRIDMQTDVRLDAVYAVRDEIVMLGFDGQLRRVRDGAVSVIACGSTRPIAALAVTPKHTWLVCGNGGFIARSPDGQWFSKVTSTVDVDLEAIATLADGTLVAVGDRGCVLRSVDDGRTWRALPNELGHVHLWAVERFGAGVLIGGDHGFVARLAMPGDATWRDRVPRTLDSVFVPGPDDFVATGLEAYLDLIGRAEPGDASPAPADDVLACRGDRASFEQIYGMPIPPEAAGFFDATANARPWDTFEELRLDHFIRPDVGDANLFELMVLRNQLAYLGTDLLEAFCGVFGIGSQGNGDTYHLELYAWDGPRQVLHFDHETAQFSGVIADSLDSLVYLAALAKAGDEQRIERATFEAGLASLHGRVAPTWHFEIDDKVSDFTHLEAKRRDTEFFFYRARWICALLKNDGVTDIADLPQLFMADFNQVVPADQLSARLEACEKFIPTALYAMWRAFLFDEPELDRYLETCRAHTARLVRDAAKLVDELRAGRNELGTIADVRAQLAAFRALDLDPRRAAARDAEAEERTKVQVARKQEAIADLDATPSVQWKDLAWRWLDDSMAHCALLERLEAAQPAQLRALHELNDLRDDELEIAVPALAATLSPEIEALLVGSLVRGDDPSGLLATTRAVDADDLEEDEDEGEDDEDDEDSPGWKAIDDVLAPIYGTTEPLHYGTVLPYMVGGNDPIHGISVYARTEPLPHWHFVTYGFTDLFQKETDDPEESGFGFELTFRLVKDADDPQPPTWALNFLQNLGRYVFGTGNRFAAGHKMGLNGPIALESTTKITAICFADDPELGEITSPFGSARFVQIVGITDDEYRLIQEWSTTGLVDILQERLPMLATDLTRSSVLDDPATAALVEQRVSKEGSSEDLTFAGELVLEVDDGRVRLELGALYAAALPRAMRGRIRHGRPYELRGRETTISLEPSAHASYRYDDGSVVLEITHELATEIEAQLRLGLAGSYRFESWPALEIVVTPSFIRSQEGRAVEVRGVADPAEEARLLVEENRRIDVAAEDEDDEDDEDDDEEDDDAEDDDDAPPSPEKVAAALAMTERALRLAPHDTDVQFTHAMLLLDGDRAGLPRKAAQLIEQLPQFAPAVRINIAVRMSELEHPRFGQVVDITLGEALPERVYTDRTISIGGAALASFGDVANELFAELGEAILERAPSRMARLIPLLPDEVNLLSELAWKSIQAKQRDTAIALYERLLALPIPDEGDERTNYLRAINNACVQAHAAKAYDAAVRIADRAQPVAHENPYIFHSAACAYAAVGDMGRALDQVRKAIEHEYDHLAKLEVDTDLGALLESEEFKTLFRDWNARREGN